MGNCSFTTAKETHGANDEPESRRREGEELLRRPSNVPRQEITTMEGACSMKETDAHQTSSSTTKWVSRYLTVTNNMLRVYTTEKTLDEIIPLACATITKKGFKKFTISSSTREHVFSCETRSNCKKWIEALKAASWTAFDKYAPLKRIGKGSSCVVYKLRHRETNDICAIKVCGKRSTEFNLAIYREAEILALCDHPNVIKFKEIHEEQTSLLIVTEFAKGRELFDYFDNSSPEVLSEEEIKNIIRSIVKAVEHLHSKQIIHGDIKPQNIMYDRDSNSVKLIDLGSAKSFVPGTDCALNQTDSFTLTYVAPEILSDSTKHGPEIDLWAVGITTYFLLSGGHVPFGGEDDYSISENIKQMVFDFNLPSFYSVTPEAKAFISSLLCGRDSRMTPEEALNHPWLVEGEIQEGMDNSATCDRDILTTTAVGTCN